jgi:hypothetical protein
MSYINKRGSVCRSIAEKQALLDEFKSSGESQSSFCAKNNICPQTFYKWLSGRVRLEPKAAAESDSHQGKFLSIVGPEPSAPSKQDDCNQNYLSLTLNLGSFLTAQYRRSFKCQ